MGPVPALPAPSWPLEQPGPADSSSAVWALEVDGKFPIILLLALGQFMSQMVLCYNEKKYLLWGTLEHREKT